MKLMKLSLLVLVVVGGASIAWFAASSPYSSKERWLSLTPGDVKSAVIWNGGTKLIINHQDILSSLIGALHSPYLESKEDFGMGRTSEVLLKTRHGDFKAVVWFLPKSKSIDLLISNDDTDVHLFGHFTTPIPLDFEKAVEALESENSNTIRDITL